MKDQFQVMVSCSRSHAGVSFLHPCRWDAERVKAVFLICLVFIALSLCMSMYLCPDQVCGARSRSSMDHRYMRLGLRHVIRDNAGKSLASLSSNPFESSRNKLSFDQLLMNESFSFNIKKNDVIVFLHIQKTGGTSFGRHLVRDLDIDVPCVCKEGNKRCKCTRSGNENDSTFWLFSRYSMGWRCGLHADWTELTNCVDNVMDEVERTTESKRRYFYITILREPVQRFVSEWKHVQRGATWRTSRHWCGGRVPTSHELPACYSGENWKRVPLNEFLDCQSNLALNRQTRMLADLTLVGCYNTSVMSPEERDVLLLASAKENLRKTAFFGILENQTVSQYLFERTFHLTFKRSFLQLNATRSSNTLEDMDEVSLERIRQKNHLDVKLYEYALELMSQRFEQVKRLDPDFDSRFKELNSSFWTPDEVEEKMIKRIMKQRENEKTAKGL